MRSKYIDMYPYSSRICSKLIFYSHNPTGTMNTRRKNIPVFIADMKFVKTTCYINSTLVFQINVVARLFILENNPTNIHF